MQELVYREDTMKLEAMIHLILDWYSSRQSRPDRMMCPSYLHKLCYLCDFGSYEKYDRSISGTLYVRGAEGPVPILFHRAIRELLTDDKIVQSGNEILCAAPYMAKDRQAVTGQMLQSQDIDLILEVLNRYAEKSNSDLKYQIMKDTPYEAAERFQLIDYRMSGYRSDKTSLE